MNRSSSRTVLVTGAAGFLGRAFARHHIAAGDIVVGIDNLSSAQSAWPVEMNAEDRVHQDLGEWLADERGSAGHFDLAYHLAAPVGGRIKIEGDPLFNADSLRLDACFFRWAADGRAGTIVYPSSSAVYGVDFQTSSPTALTEDLFRPMHSLWHAPDEMYGFTKLAGEFLAWKSAQYGVNCLCIRPFSGYGEEQSLEYPVPSIAQRVARREDPLVIWGSGDQTRDFVHVSDVVAATAARVTSGLTGYHAMNIGSGVATSFGSVARILAELEGYAPGIAVDDTKPQGVLNRYCDTGLMAEYHSPRVPLREGLAKVLAAQKAALAATRACDQD